MHFFKEVDRNCRGKLENSPIYVISSEVSILRRYIYYIDDLMKFVQFDHVGRG